MSLPSTTRLAVPLDRPDTHRPALAPPAARTPYRAGLAPVHASLSLALAYERLAITLYYTLLTTPALIRDRRLAGPSGNPLNPGLPPGGKPANVRIVQAALDAEVKHAAVLERTGAASPVAHFFFPAAALRHLGSVDNARFCLGVVHTTEAAGVGLYVALMTQLYQLHQPELAQVVVQILGVEAEHRMLSRVIAMDYPANNLTLQVAQFTCASDIQRVLQAYLTGAGLPGRTHRVVPLPTETQITHVLAKMM